MLKKGIASILLLGCISASGALYEEVVVCEFVSANRNSPSELKRELGSRSFYFPFLNKHGYASSTVKTFSCRILQPGVLPKLIIKMDGPSDDRFRRLCGDIERYFRLRQAGHSRDYATAFILGFNASTPVAGQKEGWMTKSGVIAGWVTKQKRPLAFLPHPKFERGVSSMVILDGELAWVWFRSDGDSETVAPHTIYRIDSAEFSNISSKVAKASELAAREVKPFDEYPESGTELIYWVQMKSILMKEQVRWRSPEDLNPEITFD